MPPAAGEGLADGWSILDAQARPIPPANTRKECAELTPTLAGPGPYERLDDPLFRPHDVTERGKRGMKVVIFCGGFGVRMGEATRRIPKPMIEIGGRPILWEIMQYYLAWGHTEFILCLGYKADVIRAFFLDGDKGVLNGVERTPTEDGVVLRFSDLGECRISFVDSGLHSTIAERLKAAERHLDSDPEFLATYGDAVTDAPLDQLVAAFRASGTLTMFLSVTPQLNAHLVNATTNGVVTSLEDMSKSSLRINGGFFACRRELLDWIVPGDELVEETFSRLIPRAQVLAYDYDGFFGPMDTIKDLQRLEALQQGGDPPWRVMASAIPAEAA